MAYHTLANVQDLLTNQNVVLSASSVPSSYTVADWIDETEGVVEGYASLYYTIPITGAKALAVMRRICSNLTGARVWRAAFSQDPQAEKVETYADRLETWANEQLKALERGINVLIDSPKLGTVTDGPVHNFDTTTDPVWDVGDVL